MVAIFQTSVPPLSITERQRAEQAEALLEQERSRSQSLLDRLREMGIDPDTL